MSKSLPKIRVKLIGYDPVVVDKATTTLVDASITTGAKVVGPVYLPTKISKFTMDRATFVYKRTLESFEMRQHRRLVEIVDATSKTVEALQNLQLPSAVSVEIKYIY